MRAHHIGLGALVPALMTILFISCAVVEPQPEPRVSPLAGRVICVDPGHGGTAETDSFRVGPSGEREEWVNLRVALMLRDLLEERGATVVMTRTEDVAVGLRDRAVMALDASAEVFLSIHHNATADPSVNFPIIYFHGCASENVASVELGNALGRRLAQALFGGDTDVSLVSDHVIFPTSGTAVLRHSYGIPGVIGEASFFSNPAEDQRLRDPDHNRREALAYVAALEDYFGQPILPVHEKGSRATVEPFEVFQEEERMRPEALAWRENHRQATDLFRIGTPEAMVRAYDLFTLSARAFPDSPVAGDCHWRRALILERQGHGEQALGERTRVEEHYVRVEMN